jgi:hypothetical protein
MKNEICPVMGFVKNRHIVFLEKKRLCPLQDRA